MQSIAVPITTLTGGILGLMTIILSVSVVIQRARTRASLDVTTDDKLQVCARVFGNFIEYVPIALILLALCEANGAGVRILWTIGGLLVLGRVIHAFGLSVTKPVTVARVIGMMFTWVSIGIASVVNLLHALG